MKTIKTTRYSDAHTSARKSYIKKGPDWTEEIKYTGLGNLFIEENMIYLLGGHVYGLAISFNLKLKSIVFI